MSTTGVTKLYLFYPSAVAVSAVFPEAAMRGTDRRASVRGQAARHVPVAKHPPSSHDWKAEEEDLFGLRRMAHAVERVGQIFDGGLHLLLGDPLGQEIDRHL